MSKSISLPDASINISALESFYDSRRAYQTCRLVKVNNRKLFVFGRIDDENFSLFAVIKVIGAFSIVSRLQLSDREGFGSERTINHVRKSALHVFIIS